MLTGDEISEIQSLGKKSQISVSLFELNVLKLFFDLIFEIEKRTRRSGGNEFLALKNEEKMFDEKNDL